MRRGRRVVCAAAVVVHLVVLYAPRSPDTSGTPGLDKVVHVAVFGAVVLTALLAGAPARVVVPLVAAHAVVSELVQHLLLPGRSGDPLDVVADLLGTALAAVVGTALLRRRGRPGRVARGASQPR